jgi:FolB domain-containing protein
MTLFLASVTDPEEAEIACAGGADVIDFKNPNDGALGAVAPDIIRAGAAALRARRQTSAVLGNLPTLPELVVPEAERIAETGIDFLKIGLFPGGKREATIAALSRFSEKVKLIAVFFADTAPDFSLLPLLAEAGFFGAMLDTANKTNGRLLQHIDIAGLAHFVERCRELGLFSGLAGGLELPDIPRLLLLQPDVLGFRTALCGASGRAGQISREAVQMVRDLIPSASRKAESKNLDMRLLAARGYAPSPTEELASADRVFVQDFILPVRIGVYAHEQKTPQRVRFSVEAWVRRALFPARDLRDVFSYDVITDTIRMLVNTAPIGLVETLAERIAAHLLAQNRVLKVTVKVEKLDTGSGVVGVAIERSRPQKGEGEFSTFAVLENADAGRSEETH